MNNFNLDILGCGSATPGMRHMPSSQVVEHRGRLFMIDCGEGAQLSMRRFHLNFNRLGHIFISHLHGDHCFGLPGLLSTFALHAKSGTLVIHMFREGIKAMKPYVDFFLPDPTFDIVYEPFEPTDGVIYEDTSLTIEAFPLYHRVKCSGFIFREKPKPRHLLSDMIKFYGIPIKELAAIKAGADFTAADNRVIPNSRLTTDPTPAISYAYCSDTAADKRVAEAVAGVDVIYHEGTYDHTMAALAAARGHSTARQAAEIASRAAAKTLILGHYSKRYRDDSVLIEEARNLFPQTIGANEGMVIPLDAPHKNHIVK